MQSLIKKLSRSELRGEGCHLTPAMVRWLCHGSSLRKQIEAHREIQKIRPVKKRVKHVEVTTSLIKEIRNMRKMGYTIREVAATLDIAIDTVRKYSSDESYRRAQLRESQRYAREKADPSIAERKREASRRYQQRIRSESAIP